MKAEGNGGNGEKRLGSWIYRSVHLLVNVAALALMAYVGAWAKANVPSKSDFRELQVQVIALDKAVTKLSEADKRIEDFEQRIRKLEQGRTPPRREP